MANFNDVIKKRKEEEEKKKKDKGVVIPLVFEENKKGKMDLLAFAKNPMVQMAAKAMPLKVKIIIALAVLMLLVGIGTTVYWIAIQVMKIPVSTVTIDNIFGIIGVLALMRYIYELITVRKTVKRSFKLKDSFDDALKSGMEKIDLGEYKEGILNAPKNLIEKSGRKFSNIFGFITTVWTVAGLFTNHIMSFITIIIISLFATISSVLVLKEEKEKRITLSVNLIISIGLTIFVLYSRYSHIFIK